jgi:integrase
MLPSGFEPESTAREAGGLSERWLYDVTRILTKYLTYVKWKYDEDKTLSYLERLQEHYSITSYRKRLYQIRKFLQHTKIEWANELKAPPEPRTLPKRVTVDDIYKTLDYFLDHKYYTQISALILIGATSGLRAEELYQLKLSDIDLDKNLIRVNHNPENGQTTKTGNSRITIFSEEAKIILKDYLRFYETNNRLLNLFSITHIERLFRNAPIKVKDLRKFFSQEWDRNGGSTSIKKMLMGHSGDVDTYHYNAQSEDDLLKIYNKVGIKIDYNFEEANLKRNGYKLVDFIAEKTDVKTNLVYEGAHKEDDGKTLCKNNQIIVYWNKSNWQWLREVIVHESAHRLDHKLRGNIHHNQKYSHDSQYWNCYSEADAIAKKSPFWNLS